MLNIGNKIKVMVSANKLDKELLKLVMVLLIVDNIFLTRSQINAAKSKSVKVMFRNEH